MQVNGYQLREALRRWNQRRELAAKQFKQSLYSFDEEGPLPSAFARDAENADQAVAKLQEAQQRYNLDVKVDEGKMSLALAVKMLGGAGRLEKLWRDAADPDVGKRRPWASDVLVRKADEVHAIRMVDSQAASQNADRFAAIAGKLRADIARANGVSIELDIPKDILS